MQKLIRAIDECGLLSNAEILARLDALPKSARPKTPNELADWLVEQRLLTEFQSDCLLHGKAVRLVYDEYSILDQIGAGGMGQVFKAMHRHMERVVALKVLHANVITSAESVGRFKREVNAAARLSHPNIVTAFDAGQADDAHYLVMEYVEGTNLRDLTRRKTLDIATGVNFMLQAAKGLQYAHDQGVIHRDIKPANLLVTLDGMIKILDMGIARVLADEAKAEFEATKQQLTQAGVLMGSIDFMAPEQAARPDSADQRSDIYSLGCTTFFTLAGREVYQGDTLLQRLFAHQGHDIPSLLEERDDIPPQLDNIVRKMIAKQPSERYQSMHEVIGTLSELLRQLPEGTISLPEFELPRGFLDRSAKRDDDAPKSNDAGASSDSGKTRGELRQFISSRGISDKFIDFDEEQDIFRKGGDLGLSTDEVEMVIEDICKSGEWNRHRKLSQQLQERLAEQHQSQGVISREAFDRAVGFLVDHGMRRKAAIEECLTLMLDKRWKADEGPGGSWFSRKVEQFGLD